MWAVGFPLCGRRFPPCWRLRALAGPLLLLLLLLTTVIWYHCSDSERCLGTDTRVQDQRGFHQPICIQETTERLFNTIFVSNHIMCPCREPRGDPSYRMARVVLLMYTAQCKQCICVCSLNCVRMSTLLLLPAECMADYNILPSKLQLLLAWQKWTYWSMMRWITFKEQFVPFRSFVRSFVRSSVRSFILSHALLLNRSFEVSLSCFLFYECHPQSASLKLIIAIYTYKALLVYMS